MFSLNDIVLTKDEFGKKEFIIVGICEDYYLCKRKDRKYNIKHDQIETKIGEYKPEKEKIYDHLDFCLEQGRRFSQEKEKWDFLATLQPNEKFQLIHRKKIHTVEFIKINFNKPLRPIQARMYGKIFNFSFDSFQLALQHKPIEV